MINKRSAYIMRDLR